MLFTCIRKLFICANQQHSLSISTPFPFPIAQATFSITTLTPATKLDRQHSPASRQHPQEQATSSFTTTSSNPPLASNMSSTQHAPVDAPNHAQDMATLHKHQDHKHQSHPLDTTHLNTATLATNAETEELEAARQTPTPTPTLTPTPATPTEEKNFCYCLRPESGEMIACDNPSCPREWFHLSCTEFKLKPLPPASQSWLCIPCRGWQAELEPGEPGECDDIWRCPKCGEEIVHDDDWLSGRTSKEPRRCEECGLKKGQRWEPRNMRH